MKLHFENTWYETVYTSHYFQNARGNISVLIAPDGVIVLKKLVIKWQESVMDNVLYTGRYQIVRQVRFNAKNLDLLTSTKAAFMLILRRQNQRFETLIQKADPKRPSREYCSCFPREEDDFVSMHCALFEAIVRAQVNRKGVYMTSFKRGYMWFCVHASTRISVLL